MSLESSELILNDDGSVYHLNLKPEQVAETIITVGDPDRVNSVTEHFDSIEHRVSKREFHTQTGFYKGHRISVISTGIGTDNIDIVFNELDALFNIDLETRKVKKELISLNIIRIGTSGTIQEEIPVDSWLISQYAIGFDTLLRYYNNENILLDDVSEAFISQTGWDHRKGKPYVVQCNAELMEILSSEKTIHGFTGTNVGFYAPQGRKLRLELADESMNEKLTNFEYKGLKLTNLEMETSGIYGLSKLLGHKAISMNAILANRYTGEFSKTPNETVDGLIQYTLDKLASNFNQKKQ